MQERMSGQVDGASLEMSCQSENSCRGLAESPGMPPGGGALPLRFFHSVSALFVSLLHIQALMGAGSR